MLVQPKCTLELGSFCVNHSNRRPRGDLSALWGPCPSAVVRPALTAARTLLPFNYGGNDVCEQDSFISSLSVGVGLCAGRKSIPCRRGGSAWNPGVRYKVGVTLV